MLNHPDTDRRAGRAITTRSADIGVVTVLIAALCLLSSGAAAQTKQIQMWPMRDGTRLSTTIYAPAGAGPFPTVLTRTPYPKDQPGDDGFGQSLNASGYAYIVQNTRGRFTSEGVDHIFRDDGWGANKDGYDTVELAAALPWSNGKIATFGGSALGITQELMAGAAPPHLACQIIIVASNNFYDQLIYQGGTLRSELIEPWLRGQGRYADEMPVFAAHPTRDSFWNQYDALARAPAVDVPAIFVGGWYDILSKGTIEGFSARQALAGPHARGENFLWMGPWTHGGIYGQVQGELTYPASAADNGALVQLMLAFLNHHLRGGPRPVWPAVTYYAMGATNVPSTTWNQYRYASYWPPAYAFRHLLLHADGSMSFSTKPEFGFRTFVADPDAVVPTVGGPNLTLPAGPRDQRGIEARGDVVTFQTEPLVTGLEVSGPVWARLWVQGDTPDYDVAVRLTDVYPDGRSMLVLDGIRRARFRNGYAAEQLLAPGELALVYVELWSTSIVFAPGHRLRISISGSNSPRFDANPNTGEPFRRNLLTRTATTNLWISRWTPSSIMLPANVQLQSPR